MPTAELEGHVIVAYDFKLGLAQMIPSKLLFVPR